MYEEWARQIFSEYKTFIHKLIYVKNNFQVSIKNNNVAVKTSNKFVQWKWIQQLHPFIKSKT